MEQIGKAAGTLVFWSAFVLTLHFETHWGIQVLTCLSAVGLSVVVWLSEFTDQKFKK